MRIFTWNDIYQPCSISDEVGKFFSKGSALSIGAFDGPHNGHKILFDAVKKNVLLKKGIVTFSHPPRERKDGDMFAGELSTLKLKLDMIASLSFDFAIVIDFSDDFSRIKGKDFLLILKESCSMQFLATGNDFRCGYQLDTGVAELVSFSRQQGISFFVADDVLYKNKRISSSSIRQCVLSGDLADAADQLGYSYTLDCSDIIWHISKSFSCSKQAARGSFIQALPPKGEYKVTVVCTEVVLEKEGRRSFTVGDNSNCSMRFDSMLSADFDFLRLEFPPEYFNCIVSKIIFTGNSKNFSF